jgi:uncharacterized protein YndB with AHSA1/START domain
MRIEKKSASAVPCPARSFVTLVNPSKSPGVARQEDTMAKIDNTLTIAGAPEKVFEAIVSPDGLRSWWAVEADSRAEEGGEARLAFDGGGMKVTFRFDELAPGERVRMTCVANENNPEWQDTTLDYQLASDGDGTKLVFSHDNWAKAGTKTYEMCVAGWTHFLGSLKGYVETGKGMPNGA